MEKPNETVRENGSNLAYCVVGANIDELIILKREADKLKVVNDKIIKSLLLITTKNDWRISKNGNPHLTETGCKKIETLLQIRFEVLPDYPKVDVDSQHYKTFTYKVRAYGKNTYIERIGSSCSKESIFTETPDGYRLPDQIDDIEVKIAALTNAKVNAIESIIPEIKNLNLSILLEHGINLDSKK